MTSTIRDLSSRLKETNTFPGVGTVLLDTILNQIHPSGVHICPLYRGCNLALDRVGYSEHYPASFQMQRALEEIPRSEQELGTLGSLFAWPGGMVNFNDEAWLPRLTKTATYNDYWRECGIERQVLALLGSRDNPLAFICVSRSLAEPAFTPKEIAMLGVIRAQALPAVSRLSQQPSPIAAAFAALDAASQTSSAFLAILTQEGQIAWISHDAQLELRIEPWRTGDTTLIPTAHPRIEIWAETVGRAHADGATNLSQGAVTVQKLWHKNGHTLYLVIDRARQQQPFPVATWNTLTQREREIAEQLATGHSIATISHALGIAPGTVQNHTKGIYRKLGVASRVELAARARGSWPG